MKAVDEAEWDLSRMRDRDRAKRLLRAIPPEDLIDRVSREAMDGNLLLGASWRWQHGELPAERMKMREPHIVPLSRQAVELLRELHTLTGGRAFLFPNYRRPTSCMTTTTLNRALERMGFTGKDGTGFSAHGFRATASTILNEIGYRADVIERQLAHRERNKVRASYNQAEYLGERRAMMQAWANLIDEMAKEERKVIPGRFVQAG